MNLHTYSACVIVACSAVGGGGIAAAHGQSHQDYDYQHAGNDGVGYEELQPDVGYRIFAPIHEAAKRGDIETIKGELADGAPVDLQVQTAHGGSRWWQDTTPLMWAAMLADSETVNYLVDHGADVNARSANGLTPLMAAAGAVPTTDTNALERMMILIEAGAEMEARDSYGLTALGYALGAGGNIAEPDPARMPAHLVDDRPGRYALLRPNIGGSISIMGLARIPRIVSRGDIDRVRALIAAGADVNARSENGCPLWISVINATDNERFAVLLDAGAETQWLAPDYTPLMVAASGGTGEMVERLIEAGNDVNAVQRGACESSVLNQAAGSAEDSGRKVRALLDAGADPNAGDLVPLVSAIESGNGEAIQMLIDAGADTNVRPGNGNSLFLHATEYADAAGLQAIMDATDWLIDERSNEHDGATAIHLAAASSLDAGAKVQLLLDHGADVHALTDAGLTAILAAGRRGNMNAIAALARGGADVDAADVDERHGGFWTSHYLPGRAGMTPLRYAANRGGEDTFFSEQTGEVAVRALLDQGVAFDEEALKLAVYARNADVVMMLLEARDAVEELDPKPAFVGKYANYLFKAIQLNDHALVSALLDAGADIESTRDMRETPLMVALQNSKYEVIAMLCNRGADVHATDDAGATTLMHFAMHTTRRFNGDKDQETEIFRYLIEQGVDINAQDATGATALHWCAREPGADLARLLVEVSADLTLRDNFGKTALDRARMVFDGEYRPAILEYLESVYEASPPQPAPCPATSSSGYIAYHANQ